MNHIDEWVGRYSWLIIIVLTPLESVIHIFSCHSVLAWLWRPSRTYTHVIQERRDYKLSLSFLEMTNDMESLPYAL